MTINLTMGQACEIRIGRMRSRVEYERTARLAARRGENRAEEIYLGYVRQIDEILAILEDQEHKKIRPQVDET